MRKKKRNRTPRVCPTCGGEWPGCMDCDYNATYPAPDDVLYVVVRVHKRDGHTNGRGKGDGNERVRRNND